MRNPEAHEITPAEATALLEIVKWVRIAEAHLLPKAKSLRGEPYAALIGLAISTELAFLTGGKFDKEFKSELGQILGTALTIVTLPDWIGWKPDPQWPHTLQEMYDAFFEANGEIVGDIIDRAQVKMREAQ